MVVLRIGTLDHRDAKARSRSPRSISNLVWHLGGRSSQIRARAETTTARCELHRAVWRVKVHEPRTSNEPWRLLPYTVIPTTFRALPFRSTVSDGAFWLPIVWFGYTTWLRPFANLIAIWLTVVLPLVACSFSVRSAVDDRIRM